MSSSVPVATPASFRPSQRLAHQLAGLSAGAMTLSLVVAATALASRRLAGGLMSPLPWQTLIGAIFAAAMVASMTRRLSELGSATRFQGTLDQLTFWTPGLALVIGGVALSVPGSTAPALAAVWTIIAVRQGFELWQAWRIRGAKRSRLSLRKLRLDSSPVLPASLADAPMTATIVADSKSPPGAAPSTTGIDFYPLGPNVTQQFIRTQSATTDRLQGWLQTALAAGERNVTLHVAFCPPFDESPRVALRQLSGPSSRVKPVQVLPFGMRLELKRTAIAKEQAAVIMEFTAEAPRAGDNVAEAAHAEKKQLEPRTK